MAKESAYFNVSGLNTKSEEKEIKRELDSISGVISVSVNTENNRIGVDFDNTGTTHKSIEEKITELGFEVKAKFVEEHLM